MALGGPLDSRTRRFEAAPNGGFVTTAATVISICTLPLESHAAKTPLGCLVSDDGPRLPAVTRTIKNPKAYLISAPPQRWVDASYFHLKK
jgi:hypothetical protein